MGKSKPSKEVEGAGELVTIQLITGRVISGIVIDQDEKEITVRAVMKDGTFTVAVNQEAIESVWIKENQEIQETVKE